MSSDLEAYATSGLAQGKRLHDCVLTIFGASGDLTKRKLIPTYETLLENCIEGDSTLFTAKTGWSWRGP
jgi:glucose-6-phosphate 1-dehydrogenase